MKKILSSLLLFLALVWFTYAIIVPNIEGLSWISTINPASYKLMVQSGNTQKKITAMDLATSLGMSWINMSNYIEFSGNGLTNPIYGDFYFDKWTTGTAIIGMYDFPIWLWIAWTIDMLTMRPSAYIPAMSANMPIMGIEWWVMQRQSDPAWQPIQNFYFNTTGDLGWSQSFNSNYSEMEYRPFTGWIGWGWGWPKFTFKLSNIFQAWIDISSIISDRKDFITKGYFDDNTVSTVAIRERTWVSNMIIRPVQVWQQSLQVWNGANASGADTIALSVNALAKWDSSVAIWFNAKALGYVSMALGYWSIATWWGDTAIGWGLANWGSSLALWDSARTFGIGSVSMGHNSSAYSDYDIAIWESAIASWSYNVAIWPSAKAYDRYTVAIWRLANTHWEDSVAIWWNTSTYWLASLWLWYFAIASWDYSTAIWYKSESIWLISLAAGQNSKAYWRESSAIGFECQTSTAWQYAMALWNSTEARWYKSTAIWSLVTTVSTGSIAIWTLTQTYGEYSYAFWHDLRTNVAAISWNTVMGRRNEGLSTSLFEIGNGTSNGTRSNVMTILMSGSNVGIKTTTPQKELDVNGAIQSNTGIYLTWWFLPFRFAYSGASVVAQFFTGGNRVAATAFVLP